MVQLIDKSALVAEIERLKSFYGDNENIRHVAKYNVLALLANFLYTLEAKEVDLDSDIRTYLTNHFNIYEDGILQSKKSGLPLSTYDIIKVAEHFFELGLKAQKGINQ